MDRVKLSRVRTALDDLDYPLTRTEAATALEGTVLAHAGGDDDLGALVSETASDSFESAEELESELYGSLPTDAVGEPGESEGEG